jgi:mono/diheme cytochrome c family protein
MRNFVLGVIVALLALGLGGISLALLGLFPTQADKTPPSFERRIAMNALDASMERHAPRDSSPLPQTPENLIDGMKIYTMNCAVCHGGLDRKPAAFGLSFYPPAPQLVLYPIDDPDWHVYYAVRTGIRYTGMPAWGKTMAETDMWKVTAFLTQIEKLPPPVQEYWKTASAPSVPPEPDQHPVGKAVEKEIEKTKEKKDK